MVEETAGSIRAADTETYHVHVTIREGGPWTSTLLINLTGEAKSETALASINDVWYDHSRWRIFVLVSGRRGW